MTNWNVLFILIPSFHSLSFLPKTNWHLYFHMWSCLLYVHQLKNHFHWILFQSIGTSTYVTHMRDCHPRNTTIDHRSRNQMTHIVIGRSFPILSTLSLSLSSHISLFLPTIQTYLWSGGHGGPSGDGGCYYTKRHIFLLNPFVTNKELSQKLKISLTYVEGPIERIVAPPTSLLYWRTYVVAGAVFGCVLFLSMSL